MTENSDPIQVAKEIANEIRTELRENHLSTLAYDLPTKEEFSAGKSNIPIFVVIKNFDSNVAIKLADIAKKWKDKGIEGPFIAEQTDLTGMEDSVPDELWNVSNNYVVLEGLDILRELPKFDQEYLRAQAELTIRRYIFTLRWTLSQVLHDPSQLKGYMNNLAFYSQLTIQLYHRITKPEVRTLEGHLTHFYKEFPQSWEYLKTLLEHVYDNKPLESETVELLTNTINTVLVTILRRIDEMGK